MRDGGSKIETGARTAAFLRMNWPQHARKRLMAVLPDISESTAKRILGGDLTLGHLERLMGHFGRGFSDFVLEPIVGPAPADPVIFWLTDTGPRAASSGSPGFIRDTLALAPSSVDLAQYGLNSLGWLEATLRGSTMVVRLSERGADPSAVRHCQSWLLNQAMSQVDIECERQGVAVRQRFESVRHAVQALDRHAQFAEGRDAADDHRWMINRRGFDDVSATGLRALVKAVRERGRKPGSIVSAVTDLGLMATSSIFVEHDGEFLTTHNGHRLGISPTEYVGRNVMDRKDQTYAAFVKRSLEEAIANPEGTYHELTLPINGKWWSYQRPAFAEERNPETGARFVVTSTHLLEERIAA